MFFYLIFVLIFLSLLLLFFNRNTIERYQNIITEFKIKIGLWENPGIGSRGFNSQKRFLEILSRDIPIEIVEYSNKYQPFYELQRRNVDFVFSNEKDYMIFHINQKKRIIDKPYQRQREIRLITVAYHLYYLIIADYDRILKYSDINNTIVQISPKDHLGLDSEYHLFENYKVHFKNRNEDIESAYNDLVKKSSIFLHLSNHPNKRLLQFSNEKEIYLLDALKVNNNSDYFNKYLFLNKTSIDLKYYPKILQRVTQNEIGYNLNTYSTRTILLGLNLLNNRYIYEFMKKYFSKLDSIREKYAYYNNFKDSEISYSRLGLENRILSLHPGAANFYKRIGFISDNSNLGCSLLQNECTPKQIQQYGDYLQW
jgi:hypothetical protein